jgi:hypothetical protein
MKQLKLIGFALTALSLTAFGADPQLPIPNIIHGNAAIIGGEFLPSIPPGWVIVDVEQLLNGGTTQPFVQVFLFNPTTRQHAVWLIQL